MRTLFALIIAAALLAPATGHAQSATGRYDIMRPELGHPEELPTPWLPPKYKSPRGSHNEVEPVEPLPRPRSGKAVTPPPIYVPQTGRLVPNDRVLSPSGPHGTETFQDRAVRCAHQAGAYGALTGDRSTYIGSCVNQ
jgi:hypothetical protein